MTSKEKKVKELCDEIYNLGFQQITIDMVQDEIEELLHADKKPSRDAVGALSYRCSLLMEVMDSRFEKDTSLLSRLIAALDEWNKDIEDTNIILGLPKES
jgi:hypothetical protein